MVGFFGLIMTLVLGLLVAMVGFQWLSGRRGEALPRADADRLERLESAVSSLESRIDELQDEQRFLERLLARRPEGGSLEAGPGGGRDPSSGGVDSILFDTDEENGAGGR